MFPDDTLIFRVEITPPSRNCIRRYDPDKSKGWERVFVDVWSVVSDDGVIRRACDPIVYVEVSSDWEPVPDADQP